MTEKIFEFLPVNYQNYPEQVQIIEAVYQEYCIKFDEWETNIDFFERDFLDPETCLENWLDIIAYYHGWGDVWSSEWNVEVKRVLLQNSDYIWRNRGNREILPYLFGVFGLEARLIPETGIILNRDDLINAFFENDPFSYRIEYNQNYTIQSQQYQIIEGLIKDFLPCWCKFRLVGVEYLAEFNG